MRGDNNKYKIGEIYGTNKLIDLYLGKNNRKMATVVCVKCGKTKQVREYQLNENLSCRCQIIKHGDSRKHKLYSVYFNMKYRCYNENANEYHNYGGKGICLCEEWLGEDGYTNFKNWSLQNGYKEGLTIDRIDSNGNYCPDNCQWITRGKNTSKSNSIKQHRFADKGMYYGIDSNNNYYEFDNANEFAKKHNLHPASVRWAANNNKKLYGSWTFGFVNDL